MSKALLLLTLLASFGQEVGTRREHLAEGMVVKTDHKHLALIVSCEAIPGYMDAMEMPFSVRDSSKLDGLSAGVTVRFRIVEDHSRIFAEDIQIVKKMNAETEPLEAARLDVLHRLMDSTGNTKEVKIGEKIPDFLLTDQRGEAFRFSRLQGRVVALTFGYSRCPNPDYCFRLSNNLAQLQRRFSGFSGKDLMLLTVLIDPIGNGAPTEHGTYARAWRSDPDRWRFLTGSTEQVRSVGTLFGIHFWNDEGFWTHSFRTAVVDREGRLVCNLEGNQFSARQLGDVVESVLEGKD